MANFGKQIKIAILIFLSFIIISSDIFVNTFLSSLNLTDGRWPSSTGVIVQGLLQSLFYIGIYLLIRIDVI